MVHSGNRELRMRASAIEFRLRSLIILVIILLGFWAPWIKGLGWGGPMPLLERLPLLLSRLGLASFDAAVPAVIVFAALVAGIGMVLRVWGTACLGATTVQSRDMKANAVMTGGPFRYVRNPLYLGTWCMVAALSFLMTSTGALVAMVLLTVFQLRLILGEEAFLASHLGEPYLAYVRAVPRLIPRLRSNLPPSGSKPRWLVAVLAEVNPIGIFVSLAVLSWSYDHMIMIKGILVGFGLSLVARAFISGSTAGQPAPGAGAGEV